MKDRNNKSKLLDELGYATLAKPWQLQHLIDVETAYQKYRLFRLITWSRIVISLTVLLLFIITDAHLVTSFLPIISLGIAIWGLIIVKNINSSIYPLLYALFDLFVFAYTTKFSSNSYEVGFIFLSLAFNAMLLPFMQVLLVTCLGTALLLVGWLNESFTSLTVFTSKISWEYLVGEPKLKEIVTLIIGLFSVVFTVYRLARGSLENEVKAIIQHKQLRQILSFNRTIIENFNNGIIIFSANADTQIISINKKAIELLNLNSGERISALSDLSFILFEHYKDWVYSAYEIEDNFTYQHNTGAEEVFISFTEFAKTNQNSIIMMTLESVNKTLKQAQEAKLVALGKLTAGIAHEIRNPLASISSAADLLQENSDEISKQKLIPIINNNVQRTNRIINDILCLFKDKQGDRKLLSVELSIRNFADTFLLSNKENSFKISIQADCTEELYFRFDTTQLDQILWNLFSNSVKYAESDNLELTIKYELSKNRKNLHIYIYDNGQGINRERAKRIFEPFYTGSSEGSGLGLYLVRELCSANNANVSYLPPEERDEYLPQEGACFRLFTPVYFSKNIKPQIND